MRHILTCILMIITVLLSAQTNYRGMVITNEDKLPINGASINVKGSQRGVKADSMGSFAISGKAGDVLIISYIGYKTEEFILGNKINFIVNLKSITSSLNEVVVTGYSTQRKKDITGSVAIVNVTNLKAVPSGTTEALLQGQAAGVTVINSGNPGGGSMVNIWGISTIGSSSPLVLIDGVPGSMHDLNVNDIASMQVLKDAGAAAIYGVRGSNGVIIITTKKGKIGKTELSYDAYAGVQRPLSEGFKLADTKIFMDAIFQMQKNSGINPAHPQFGTSTFTIPDYITPAGAKEGAANTNPVIYDINTNQITRANKTGTDWFHEIFKPAPIQSHNITVSGGSAKSAFLISMGYFDQEGTMIKTFLKRYSLRANSSFNIGDHIRIGENVYLFYKRNPLIGNQNEGNSISYSYREPSIIPVYDIMGNFAGTKSPGLSNSQNPVANQLRSINNRNYDWQINGNVFAEVDVLRHFTLRTSFGGNLDNYYSYSFFPTAYENAEGNTSANLFTEFGGFAYSRIWTNTLTYNQIIGKHTVKLLGGLEAIGNYGRGQTSSKGSYTLSTDPNYLNLNTGSPSSASNAVYQLYSNTLYSQFGRLDYNYDDRYLISGILRRDGSSFFAPDHQYGVFPSATLGWRISKEAFFKNITGINELKLRGGYGKLGSLSGVSNKPYNAYSLYAADPARSFYDLNGTGNSTIQGTYNSQLGNLNTTWESDAISNLGLDITVLNNKLDISFEVYKKSITGLLFQSTLLAPAGGATPPYINGGNIENSGFDFSFAYHENIREFRFDVNANISHYKSKVISLPNLKYQDFNSSGSTRIGNYVRLQPGHAVGAYFGYKVIGLFRDAADVSKSPTQSSAAPGRFKYLDADGDGKITDADRTFFGDPNPKLTGGFNITGAYKNFDLNLFLYGSYGNKVINYTKYWTNFPQVFGGNVSADILSKSWRPDNLNATIPILETSANFSNTGVFNSFYQEDGSYLRLKSLSIGYTTPTTILKRFGISKFRIYALAANLFTITKYSGLDPELQNSNLNDNTSFGIDFGNYPANQKNYNIGVNMTF